IHPDVGLGARGDVAAGPVGAAHQREAAEQRRERGFELQGERHVRQRSGRDERHLAAAPSGLLRDQRRSVPRRDRLRVVTGDVRAESFGAVHHGEGLPIAVERLRRAARDLHVSGAGELEDQRRVARHRVHVDVARDARGPDQLDLRGRDGEQEGDHVVDTGVDIEDERGRHRANDSAATRVDGRPLVRSATPTMDLVIRNAKVWTVDERRPTAEAVGIRDDRIAAVGDDREVRDAVGAGAEELDAGGKTVLPGFIDAHNHLRPGADADAAPLGDAPPLDAVRAAIDGYATEHPDREWIVAEDWSYAALPERRRPTAKDLEGVAPGRALMVFSYDVHNVWLNREAMRRFGIGAAEGSLAFGRPERDAGTSEPTGFVTDFAVMGLSRDGQAALAAQV